MNMKYFFFFQAEDGIRDLVRSRGLGDVYKRQGATEALICIQAVREGLIPPTVNLERPEEGLGINVVRGQPLRKRVEIAVSNSFGFGGHNAVLVVGPPPD
mgnify:CR=1 FL=1